MVFAGRTVAVSILDVSGESTAFAGGASSFFSVLLLQLMATKIIIKNPAKSRKVCFGLVTIILKDLDYKSTIRIQECQKILLNPRVPECRYSKNISPQKPVYPPRVKQIPLIYQQRGSGGLFYGNKWLLVVY